MYYSIHMNEENIENYNESIYFSEAVFAGGKEKVMPLVDQIQKIKDELDARIKEQEDTSKAHKNDPKVKVKEFNPTAFWKNTMFKDLEDDIRKIFGFRNVEIHPYREKYLSGPKKFESRELNCCVYHEDRFPVEGLVTDNGFYDKSHSLTMEIYISLGLLRDLTAEEVIAVLLHEFGHSIDPALTDIKYTETNILSKYITDRKGAINREEKRVMNKFVIEVFGGIILISLLIKLKNSIVDLFKGKERLEKEKLEKIKKAINNDKEEFNRQNYSEAFADNFSRMYGFGPALINAIKKLSNDMDREMRSRYTKEKKRQEFITSITIDMINDVHKTDIHRIRSLIKEYKDDINDPNTPPVVKKQLQEDLTELEKVLDQYLNHRDAFQKRVNNLINEELSKLEDEDNKKSENKKSDNKDKK